MIMRGHSKTVGFKSKFDPTTSLSLNAMQQKSVLLTAVSPAPRDSSVPGV